MKISDENRKKMKFRRKTNPKCPIYYSSYISLTNFLPNN